MKGRWSFSCLCGFSKIFHKLLKETIYRTSISNKRTCRTSVLLVCVEEANSGKSDVFVSIIYLSHHRCWWAEHTPWSLPALMAHSAEFYNKHKQVFTAWRRLQWRRNNMAAAGIWARLQHRLETREAKKTTKCASEAGRTLDHVNRWIN